MSANTAEPLSLSAFPRAVLHIDGDAFFTSVEEALRPEFKGKPLVTGRERGIVACASYEAKARGVRRPMRLADARKICPGLIALPSDYETYSLYSERMFEIVRRFTPTVEEYSIDEAFAEITGLRRLHHTGYAAIAWKVKQAVQKELGLTVSVGLSSSKTLAKLASKRDKPDGFTVLPASSLHRTLVGIPTGEVCGFGPNTVALLEKRGVRDVWGFVQRSERWASDLLGKIGMELWNELRGVSVYPIAPEHKHQASISKCRTFTPPSTDREFVRSQLARNVESAFIKLRRHRLRADGVAVYLRDAEFKTAGVEAEFERSTSSVFEGVKAVLPLFDRLFAAGKAYRLTGVVLFRLKPDSEVQYSLFDDIPRLKSLKGLDRVIDGAAALYGKHALRLGSSALAFDRPAHGSERAVLPRRKQDLLAGETERRRLRIPMWQVKV